MIRFKTALTLFWNAPPCYCLNECVGLTAALGPIEGRQLLLGKATKLDRMCKVLGTRAKDKGGSKGRVFVHHRGHNNGRTTEA